MDNATLELQILSGGIVGESWNSPEFELIAMKRDMNPVREVDQDKFTILSNDEHKVRIELKEQFLTCRGTVKMQLVIKDGSRTSTTIFRLSIGQSLDSTILESLKDIKVLDDLDEVVELVSTFEVTATNNEAKRQHNEKLREVAESNRQDEFDKAQNQRDTKFNEKMEEYQEYVSGLEGIQGKPGETLQIRVNETHIQVKYPSQQDWTDLIALDRLKGLQGEPGPKGDPGERGIQGQTGKDGVNGKDGITPNLTIGTVTTLEPGEQASVTIRGTKENPILDIAIPRGEKGKDGQGGGGSGVELVAKYIHTGNKEIVLTAFDHTTGEFTWGGEPTLAVGETLYISPNVVNEKIDLTKIPIEFFKTGVDGVFKVHSVSDNKFKLADSNNTPIIYSTQTVDINYFKFENFTPFSITNLNINQKIKVLINASSNKNAYDEFYFDNFHIGKTRIGVSSSAYNNYFAEITMDLSNKFPIGFLFTSKIGTRGGTGSNCRDMMVGGTKYDLFPKYTSIDTNNDYLKMVNEIGVRDRCNILNGSIIEIYDLGVGNNEG